MLLAKLESWVEQTIPIWQWSNEYTTRFKNIWKRKSIKGSFKRYVTLFLAKIWLSFPPLEWFVTFAICPFPMLRNEICSAPSPVLDWKFDWVYLNVWMFSYIQMLWLQCSVFFVRQTWQTDQFFTSSTC